MAADITNTIVDRLLDVLARKLQTEVGSSDPLRAKIVARGPLQDDPTLMSNTPFVFVNPDDEQGTTPDTYNEIGGAEYFVDRFVLTARPPVQRSKLAANLVVGQLRNRILAAVRDQEIFRGLTNDTGNQTVWSSTAQGTPIVKSTMRVFGGEDNWLSECRVELSYRWLWSPGQ